MSDLRRRLTFKERRAARQAREAEAREQERLEYEHLKALAKQEVDSRSANRERQRVHGYYKHKGLGREFAEYVAQEYRARGFSAIVTTDTLNDGAQDGWPGNYESDPYVLVEW